MFSFEMIFSNGKDCPQKTKARIHILKIQKKLRILA
jgi:hypothetical protein